MQGNEGLSWESPQQAICKYIYLFRQIHFQLGQVYLLIWTTHTIKSATSQIINPWLYWEWFQLEQFAKEFAKKNLFWGIPLNKVYQGIDLATVPH